MNGTNHPAIATTLAEKVASGDDWDTVPLSPTEEIEVMIQARSGAGNGAASAVESLGGTVHSNYADLIEGRIRADRIIDLAEADEVRMIEQRYDPQLHSTSEGVTTTNADDLQNLGLNGENVTVAVIDIQFDDSQTEIADQVIDTIGSYSYDDPGTHGTACAEIVAEMAPQADLVLASTQSYGILQLIDEITLQHDPEVMSMSLGYKPTLRLDGQDSISQRIQEYTSGSGSNTPEGGIFCVSAGNEANGAHFDRQWTDTNGNGYLEFDDSGTEKLQVDTFASGQELVVQSDDDWSVDKAFSLELYDGNGNRIKDPAPTNTPAENISLPSDTSSYLKIKSESLDGDEHFDIFTWGNYLELPVSTSERSLGIPATAPDDRTLTTGAVQHDTDDLESYSSRGPTQDGRRGMDICAPADTESDTYNGSFAGTSAACPHAAGAAALLSEFSTVDNDDVVEALSSMARSIRSDEDDGSLPASRPNTEVGDGHVELQGALDELVGLVQKGVRDPGIGEPQFASPSVDDLNVYVAGLGGSVEAYPRTTDTLAWGHDRQGDLSDCSPVAKNGKVYVGSGGGRFYAFPSDSATPDWTRDIDSAITSTPLVEGSTVYFAANDGTVRAADDGASGSILWEQDVGGLVFSDLAYGNGLLFVTTDEGELVCLDTTNDGAVQWRFDTGTELGASSPTVANGRVFVAADRVYAFDLSNTQNGAWDSAYGGTAGSSPAYSNGTVFVGSADGKVYAFDDTASGSQLWVNSTGDAVGGDPAAPGDRVLVASTDGNLYAYLEDGNEIGSRALPDTSLSTPVVSDNDVFLLTANGKLVRH